MTPYRSLAGVEQRVRHSNRRHADELRLGFRQLTETELHLLVDHYQGQKGGRISFALSAEVTYGMPAGHTPAGHSWIYIESPKVLDHEAGRHDVEVVLGLVPEAAG